MECNINRERIKDAIQSKIINILTENGFSYYEGVLAPTEQDISVVDYVNSIFQENVVNQDFEINISEELVDAYMSKYQNIVSNQEEDLFSNPTKVSVNTPAMVRVNRFLDQAGVQVESLESISMNGQNLGVEGIALPLQALIQHVSTAEDSVLTEEAMHIAVELISQKDKGLFDAMMSKITSYPIYGETFRQYKDLEAYQTNGKPNITKIKKEAIGKLLTQAIINNQEIQEPKSWWAKVKNYLKGLFSPLKQEINDFNQAISTIFDGDLGTIRDTLLQSKEYLVENGFDSEQADRVINLAQSDITDYELRIAMGNMQVDLAYYKVTPTIERKAQNIKTKSETITYNGDGTYTVNGKKLTYSDILEAERALSKKMSKANPEYAKILSNIQNNETSAELDIVRDVLSKVLDSDGMLSTIPTDNLLRGKDAKYQRIAKQVLDKVNEFPQGTVFLSQTKISDDRAGATVDLIAIDNTETVHLFNFHGVTGEIENAESQALKAELETARQILAKGYNISKFGQSRTLILDKEVPQGLSDENDYPRPIVTDSETIGAPTLDLIYNQVYIQNNKSRIKRPATQDELRQNKTLNGILAAYKTLQVKATVAPIVSQMKELTSYMEDLTQEFNNKYRGKRNIDYSSKDVQRLMTQMAITLNLGEGMSKTSRGLAEFNKNRGSKVDTSTVSKAEMGLKDALVDMQSSINTLIDQYSNTKYQIFGVTLPEVIQSYLPKSFRTSSQQTQTSIQVLTRIAQDARGKAELRQSENINIISKIKDEVVKLAKSKGISLTDSRKLLAPITQQSADGSYIHRLIPKVDRSFYEQAVEARKNKNINWVKENIDMEAYQEWFEEAKALTFGNIENTVVSYNEDITNEEMVNLRKEEWLDRYDLSRGLSTENSKIANFPQEDKHYSKEYRELLKKSNKPYLDLYNMFQSLNERASELGILDEFNASTFLPEVGASLLEKAIYGKNLNLKQSISNILEGHEDYIAYGEYRPASARERSIPFNLIQSVSKRKINENGEVITDYSNVSTDIFQLLEAYSANIEVYNTYSESEQAITLLRAVEANKPSLSTNKETGKLDDVPQEVENTKNLENLDRFIAAEYYGKKYDDDINGVVTININNITKGINNKFGSNLRTDYSNIELPIKRVLDASRDYFIFKVLGWNPATAITNLLGTHMQAAINAGHWFTKKEFELNNLKVFQDKLFSMSKKEKTTRLGLIDYFVTLTDNESNYDSAKRLTLNKLADLDVGHSLMYLLRNSDKPVQWAMAASFLENTILQDGKLINAREYLRSQDKYVNMYNGTTEQTQTLKAEFEREVQNLKDTQGLSKIAKFNSEGLLEIPGVERTSDTVVEVRRKIQQLAKDATGMGTINEFRPINANFFMRNALTFFSWAPRLIEQRFAGTRRTGGALNMIEQGRVRTFANALNKALFESGTSLKDLIKLSERGVESIKEEFQKTVDKYEKRTGKQYYERGENEEANRAIAERDFIEMYQRNVKNQFLEFKILASTFGILLGLVKLAPDDDDELKGVHKYAVKIARKALGELSFYYNPLSLKDLGSGKILPAINVIDDFQKLARATNKELFGTEEQQEKTQWLGKLMKTLPIVSQVSPMLSIFNEDLAKELDYTLPEATVFEPPRNN